MGLDSERTKLVRSVWPEDNAREAIVVRRGAGQFKKTRSIKGPGIALDSRALLPGIYHTTIEPVIVEHVVNPAAEQPRFHGFVRVSQLTITHNRFWIRTDKSDCQSL